MGEKTDKAKGHVKEAVGDATDNERLEREGKADRMGGELKGRAEDATAAVRVLADFDWLRSAQEQTAGRTRTVYILNPACVQVAST